MTSSHDIPFIFRGIQPDAACSFCESSIHFGTNFSDGCKRKKLTEILKMSDYIILKRVREKTTAVNKTYEKITSSPVFKQF